MQASVLNSADQALKMNHSEEQHELGDEDG